MILVGNHLSMTLTLCHLCLLSTQRILRSAYNIFFKEERGRILGLDGNQSTSAPEKKVGFANLAKTVAARWKAMTSEEERAPYKEKAAVSFSHVCVFFLDWRVFLFIRLIDMLACIYCRLKRCDIGRKWKRTSKKKRKNRFLRCLNRLLASANTVTVTSTRARRARSASATNED